MAETATGPLRTYTICASNPCSSKKRRSLATKIKLVRSLNPEKTKTIFCNGVAAPSRETWEQHDGQGDYAGPSDSAIFAHRSLLHFGLQPRYTSQFAAANRAQGFHYGNELSVRATFLKKSTHAINNRMAQGRCYPQDLLSYLSAAPNTELRFVPFVKFYGWFDCLSWLFVALQD